MNDSFEQQCKTVKPAQAPKSWKTEILVPLTVTSESTDALAWWEVFRIPRELQWGLMGLWLLVLVLKGITPDTGRSALTPVSLASIHDHQLDIRMAAAGYWPRGAVWGATDEKGAHFEFKLYENE